ncbi:GNAT family N-acetyltransferase [Catellatospora tritici]|uniref:GNAT family N-acetyltransferase n=1 Tax=Catellatospora tritici TaxID=2851566 RepID=UPI001C2DE1D3|nr:GNAT family N-acetyltransferase [Catellatospora tritici]MBV1849269.1 GNAT family N-acetyltransferase [Catellatospora tritici]
MSGNRVGGDLLDNVAWAALSGPLAGLARRHGQAGVFDSDVSPFGAVAPGAGAQGWADFAELLGPGGSALLTGDFEVPDGWTVRFGLDGVQLVDVAGVVDQEEPEAVLLGAADVPEMLDLVARTKPGPFGPRTVEMGTYLGIRRDGVLVAMAGERLRLPGYTEISAVCTDPAARGQGLAGRLVRAVGAVVHARGDTPFLHAAVTNTNAIRLYQALGFERRRQTPFAVVEVPQP